MSQVYKSSSLITFALIFLLPIFFVPGGALGLGSAKSLLLVLGTVALVLAFLLNIWKEGKVDFPWHPVLVFVVLLPVVYMVSALSSTPSSLSLLGYNFEVGTFGYMLLGSVLVVLAGTIFSDASRILQALVAFFLSISIVALFVMAKIIFGGEVLNLGNFSGNMANPLGNWTDIAVSFGLLSSFAALALGVIPMKLSARILVYIAFILGVVLLAIINFSVAFGLTLSASVLLVLYFWKMEKRFSNTGSVPETSRNFLLKPTFLPIVLGVVSLAFLINPTVSGTQSPLSDVIARTFNVQNLDVRPSFSATLGISRAVLSQEGFLGSGPNTFDRDWLIYKPADINTTPFWSLTFPFGVGFLPTQVVTTGALGTVLWLAFFALLIALGIKVLTRLPESRAERFTLVASLLIVFFLWASSFVYGPSATVLMFAFIFTGVLLAAARSSGIISSRTVNLKESPKNRFVSLPLITLVAIGAVYLGWSSFEKSAAAYYFKNAVDLSNAAEVSLDETERLVSKAISFEPTDTYYVALSRINFAQAQAAANATEGTPEDNQRAFEDSVRVSIESAKLATEVNPSGYQNWIALGLVYSALVPAPLSTAGAYENASFAFSEASKNNPLNPEIPLFVAQLELNKGDRKAAISAVRNSIALKEDYADAHLLLAQLEIQEGNTRGAITSAERLASLTPDNPGIHFELGVLKYSISDYKGAEETFKKALALAPDYANAQYYLGLSLAQEGRLEEALEQFEALAKTNPDSEEVQKIIKDLKAGKDSFLDSVTR